MTVLRLRVACRGQVELHEIERDDITLGRAPDSCDFMIDHPSIASKHARLLVRRGRVILADLGRAKTGTTRGRERVLAPVTLEPGELFGIGDVTLSAWTVSEDQRGLVGRNVAGAQIAAELESPDPYVRRYLVKHPEHTSAELVVSETRVPKANRDVWLEKAVSSEKMSSSSMPKVISVGIVDDRASFIEVLPNGMRLSSLLDGISRGAVHLPIEATIVILAHLADAVLEMDRIWGAHGAIDPRSVQLGVDGSVSLLRPGPYIEGRSPLPDAYLAPERRYGLGPTLESDAFSLGVLGKVVLGRRSDCPMRIRAVCYWLAHFQPERRPKDLREVASELRFAAQNAGRDPTFGHVARAVRLLSPSSSRRLCTTIDPRLASG